MERKRIKWGNIFVLLLIIAAAVAAFYYKSPGSFSGIINNRSQKEESEQVKENISAGDFVVGLDSWIGGTPALMALGREYYKDYDLSLKLKYIPSDEDRMRELKDGKISVTEISLPSFVRLNDKYKNTGVIVGITDFSRGADGIVARSEIKNLNDMEGKRISFVGDGTGKFILNKFLRLTGLRYQDIEPIERNGMSEVVADLKTGKADLIVSWSPDMNLAVKEINGLKPNSVKLLITTKEVPDLVPTVLLANKKAFEKQPEKIMNFLKTWYISSKYIIEKPDKAYEKLAELMNEKKDVYGEVAIEDVKESFANIKLMSLNDNFVYFGLDGKEIMLKSIIEDTAETWKKYGVMTSENIVGEALSSSLMDKLNKEKDQELLVGALGDEITGNAPKTSESKQEFKKQDEVSIEKNTEKVAKVDILPVYYDSGKATVKQDSIPVLNEVFNILKQFPQYYLIIDAHTDSAGSEEFNLKLSIDRAQQVKNYLVSQGVEQNRIVARGWGEYRLIVPNEKNEEEMAKNRRTEFVLTREIR